jgi:tRNA(adenine34) deaminase
MCAGACVNAKLGKLVFGAFDESAGCCGTRMDLTDHCFLHTVETWGGVLEADCKELLSSFFKELR